MEKDTASVLLSTASFFCAHNISSLTKDPNSGHIGLKPSLSKHNVTTHKTGLELREQFSSGVFEVPSPLSVSGFGAPQSKIFSAICGHYREKAAFGNESVSVLGQRER